MKIKATVRFRSTETIELPDSLVAHIKELLENGKEADAEEHIRDHILNDIEKYVYDDAEIHFDGMYDLTTLFLCNQDKEIDK